MKRLSRRALFAYGLFGLPLALVALPVYVYVPQFYSDRFGLSLTAIGAALLLARLFDAFLDPAIGYWLDRVRRRASSGSGFPGDTRAGYSGAILLALPALAFGFIALFHPPELASDQPLVWFVAALLLVYAGFSIATIAHQSWGAGLSSVIGERSRVTATREACALVGVILAAVMPVWLSLGWLSLTFIVTLLAGSAVLLIHAPRPRPSALFSTDATLTGHAAATHEPASATANFVSAFAHVLRNRPFRWLFAVYIINGIAAAIPATLFLFFARDKLQLGDQAGLFLVLYFVAAAASMPLWVTLARRLGEARAWMIGMFLSIAAFVWVIELSAGDGTAFGVICVLSGLALGADLALPPALLAGVIGHAGHDGQREGSYFGAWNWATKINLALAAGISLPLLEALGYTPAATDAAGLQALSIGYAVLPCFLKLMAAALLWRAPLRQL